MPPRTLRLSVEDGADGSRLDAFLAAHDDALTRSAWKRVIEEGRVTVGGRVAAKPGFALKKGATVEAEIPELDGGALEGEAIPVDVVHEDDHLAVIDKPAGLAVHPGHGRPRGTLVQALLGRGMTLAPAGGERRPGIVHRLDKDTSGLLVVAKTDRAHRALVAQFARREVRKTYVALVWGRPSPADGRIDEAIGRSRRDPTKMAIRVPRARHATTVYRTVETIPGFALLEIELVTGRTHQIRVHLASRGHAVLGDERYGGAPWKSLRDLTRRRAVAGFHRYGLHAARLALAHPITGAPLAFASPLPPEFRALLTALREGA